MNSDLLVSFKIGNRQEVWIQHPILSQSIHSELDCNQVEDIGRNLAQVLDIDFDYFDLDEIHCGEGPMSVELWDYSIDSERLKQIIFEETTE